MHTEIYCFGWWMGAYGGKSPKRHRGFSNNAFSSRLDLGVFRRAQQAKQKQIQTTKRYQKRNGEFGYVGTKQLKGTQPGPYMIGLQEFYWFPSHGMFGFFILYKFIRMDMFRRRTLYWLGSFLKLSCIKWICLNIIHVTPIYIGLPIPRVYPRAFAERIRVLFNELVLHGEGQPAIQDSENYTNAGPVEFESLNWSDWEEAGLMGPLRYARGNNRLNVPEEWKSTFPLAFEILAYKDAQKKQ